MNLPDAAIVVQQMAKAIAEKRRCLTAWRRHECQIITEAHLRHAELSLRRFSEQLASLDDSMYREKLAQLPFISLRHAFARLLGLDSLDWFCTSILIALPAFALPALVLVLVKVGVGWILGISFAAYILAAITCAIVLYTHDHSDFVGTTDELIEWIEHRRRLIAETAASVTEAEARLSEYRLILHYQTEYESANQYVLQLRKLKKSLKRAAHIYCSEPIGGCCAVYPLKPSWPMSFLIWGLQSKRQKHQGTRV